MDYENKRKEEINRATQLWECGDITRENLEYIFPELRESEDEKIRKVIRGWIYAQPTSFFDNGISKEEMLAWLENKGEQNSTPPKWKYKKDKTPLLRDSIILNKYGCVAKSPSGAIVHDVWVLDYDELAKLPKEEIEKQGEQKPIIDGILTATNYDKMFQSCKVNKFNVGDWITNGHCTCQISFIDSRYWCSETRVLGDTTSIDNTFHLWTIADAKDGDVLVHNSITFIFKGIEDGIVNGLCSELSDTILYFGEPEYEKDYHPATKEQRDLLFQEMKEDGYDWDAEKKEFRRNVKPKFKVGDWIIFNERHNSVYQVERIDDYRYYLRHYLGGTLSVHFDNEFIRPWTIQDAKDGDVLFSDLMNGKTFIYNGVNSDKAILYSFIISNDGDYVLPYHIGKPNTGIGNIEENKNIIRPATKEQRDILFAKMKEAGYEWDAEKKELKKIEQEPADKAEPKFKVGNWYQCTKDFFGKGVTFDKNTAYYCAKEGCLQNEYGCHIAIVKDLYDNFKLWTIQDAKDGDVLACPIQKGYEAGEQIFIFKGINSRDYVDDCIEYYCRISEGVFYENKNGYMGTTSAPLYPATKEQRDTLFSAMKAEGYEWDAEKKELRKIEQVSAWSEEDEHRLEDTIYFLDTAKKHYASTVELDACIDWINSIKQRMEEQQ